MIDQRCAADEHFKVWFGLHARGNPFLLPRHYCDPESPEQQWPCLLSGRTGLLGSCIEYERRRRVLGKAQLLVEGVRGTILKLDMIRSALEGWRAQLRDHRHSWETAARAVTVSSTLLKYPG